LLNPELFPVNNLAITRNSKIQLLTPEDLI